MKNEIRDEKGQALILVLVLLLLGALIITPLLSFMGTGLRAGQVFEKKMDGFYAADAGVEDALWKIKTPEVEIPTGLYYLTDTVNDMLIEVLIDEVTTFYGEEVGEGNYPNYWIVGLESGLIDDPDDTDYKGDYTYRLILTNKHNKNIGIEAIKISFPTDLDYPIGYQVDGLYNGDGVELWKGDFADGELIPPELGYNQILTWDFDPDETKIDGNPFADPSDPESWVTVSCIFQLVGFDDAPEISNFILVGGSEDIGTVWEWKPFIITAKAYDEGTMVTTVTARALRAGDGGTVSISHWETE